MAKKAIYTVQLDEDVVKFSNYKMAMHFAQRQSLGNRLMEVHHKTGIVGQYRDGLSTPEFRGHHDTLENCPEAR